MAARVGAGLRASWARALDAVAALGAQTIIAGHRNPRAAIRHRRRAGGAACCINYRAARAGLAGLTQVPSGRCRQVRSDHDAASGG